PFKPRVEQHLIDDDALDVIIRRLDRRNPGWTWRGRDWGAWTEAKVPVPSALDGLYPFGDCQALPAEATVGEEMKACADLTEHGVALVRAKPQIHRKPRTRSGCGR